MRRSRKLRDAAVRRMRTWLGPGVGTGVVVWWRSWTDVAVGGMVQAAFVVESRAMMGYLKNGVDGKVSIG